ncbi:MAG TPA: BrnT family toxin [Burkholderiaceae bacterium]|nr:BrnT family toxin [Burkholderiaceae bacterium]
MSVEHDPKKDAANRRKHGVSLSEGDGVTDDPFVLTLEDESSPGEQRFIALGRNILGKLRLVVYTYRGDDVRLISVRLPDAKQARAYEQGT